MPIGTILIFSIFPKNVRTAGPTGMDEALIDFFDLGKMMVPVENRLVALGTRTAVPSLHLLPTPTDMVFRK